MKMDNAYYIINSNSNSNMQYPIHTYHASKALKQKNKRSDTWRKIFRRGAVAERKKKLSLLFKGNVACLRLYFGVSVASSLYRPEQTNTNSYYSCCIYYGEQQNTSCYSRAKTSHCQIKSKSCNITIQLIHLTNVN